MALRRWLLCFVWGGVCALGLLPLHADRVAVDAITKDWTMYKGNAGRTAQLRAALPGSLRLQWTRELESPTPAWPMSQNKLRFDLSYEPVVMGKRLFVGSMVNDRVTAYATDTGEELWRFYANGPIRFAPVAWNGRVYFVSDDGFLYCVDAASGKRIWSVRGGPDGRMAIGNGRVISVWPARGAPVLWEDAPDKATIYFAASVWPFMGTFIRAVDATSGAAVWSNTGSGANFLMQQHSSPAFAGVAPQGYLAASESVLLVSGGRTVPAAYDRKTGEFMYFKVASRAIDKSAGGFSTSVNGEYFISGGAMYRAIDAEPVAKGPLTMLGDLAISPGKTGIDVFELIPQRKEEIVKDRKGTDEKRVAYTMVPQRTLTLESPIQRFFFSSIDRAFGSGLGGLIGAVNLDGKLPAVTWTANIQGEVYSMTPGDDKLFVVSTSGKLFCFGASETQPKNHKAAPAVAVGAEWRPYAVIWNGAQLDQASVLAKNFEVLALEQDESKATALRRAIDDAGLDASAHVLQGQPAEWKLPPYFAERIEVNAMSTEDIRAGLAGRVFHCLRPYGGVAMFHGAPETLALLTQSIADAKLAGAVAVNDGRAVKLTREGALPGSAPWTHQYADVANSVLSRDALVKPPLGLLWFGGPSNDDVLPRHGHGPTPHVIGGRLFIEGPNAIRAIDVYTGRLLWQREMPGLGRFYDNTNHQPGATEIGSNYVSTADTLYVVLDRKCLRLDPATGKTVGEFTLPSEEGQPSPHWGYVGVYEDLLIATAMPVAIRVAKQTDEQSKGKADDEDKVDDKIGAGPEGIHRDVQYASSSALIVVMDRQSGKVVWTRKAQQVFRHNAIAVGAGKLFCIDAIPQAKLDALKRRGEEPQSAPRLLALNVRTGELAWESAAGATGTWLGYSVDNDVVLSGGSPSRDRAKDEAAGGMAAFRGADGKRVWRSESKYGGTPILHGKTIYTDGAAFEMLSGKPLQRESPITGQRSDWTFARNYGCNTPIAGEHMLLFRSAAAGFFDLRADAGTGNWGGFKSGCTSNLLPADGVLVAPDFTRTCTCSYQNQSSLALVSMPDVEMWSFQSYDEVVGRIKRLGINFGAPGDWHSPEGTLWLDYPSVGGKSPKVAVQVEGETRQFRGNAMELEGPARQVTASGLVGAASIKIGLNGADAQKYTVRLFFREPESIPAGERVFDVTIQGAKVLADFDIIGESKTARLGIVKEFRGVAATDSITIELAAKSKRLPVLCGVELLME